MEKSGSCGGKSTEFTPPASLFFLSAGGEVTFFLALVSLGVGFLADFLGAVFFAAGFAAVFFSGAAEADLADFLATDFLAGAFFFVAGFAAVFFSGAAEADLADFLATDFLAGAFF
ncbi:MAG: hypothetical protein HOL38_04465, partial [Verrucomicrobia bacterium]|nr:hypothetical protein [Verrucomicrobiota bacterium]